LKHHEGTGLLRFKDSYQGSGFSPAGFYQESVFERPWGAIGSDVEIVAPLRARDLIDQALAAGLKALP
jgi:hypothetical protein